MKRINYFETYCQTCEGFQMHIHVIEAFGRMLRLTLNCLGCIKPRKEIE